MPLRPIARWPISIVPSLRSKVIGACLLLTTIATLLGIFAQQTQRSIGAVGVRMYDQTFMSMSYLRSSQNTLLKFRAAIERAELRLRDRAPEERTAIEESYLKIALPDIMDDLRVTIDRAATADTKRSTQELYDRLSELEGALREGGASKLLADLDEVQTAYDNLVEVYAADGFSDRRQVATLIAASEQRTLLVIVMSVILAAVISYGLIRSVLPPIREAVRVARAISTGRLDNEIRPHGSDEIALLLGALAAMQSSLVDKIGRIESLAAEAQTQAAQLRLQNGRFEGALDNMIQGLCMFDGTGRLVVHNKRFEAMFGAPTVTLTPASTGLPDILKAPIENQSAGRTYEMPDGRVIAASYAAITDGGWVSTYEDVTERHRVEASLERMARYDGLTLLPNRMFFRERLEEALGKGRKGGLVVLCLDLDGFKTVNDTLGHAVGDSLLQAVSQRLLDCVQPGDVVGRLGGDEFAIVQSDPEDTAETEALANRIIRAVAAAFEVDAFQVTIGVSIGIAREDDVSDSSLGDRAAALLKNADVALYRAKVEGRGTFRFFAAEMDRKLQARRVLELDLRGAIEKEQFELYFQPLVDTDGGSVCCFEALLRWNHPEKGMVSPAEFIPLAEETGLIKVIGRWVLQRACAEAASWPRDISVAINLSPVQFQNPFLAAEVVAALDVSGLAPQWLELEITESVLIMEDELVLNTLHQVRSLGVRIALDDFGTGYSSLSYLRRFPFDKIKIDRSFVADLGVEDNLAIVKAIMGLGQALGMAVVAEGVETPEQEAILVDEGCTELQGYYFSPPRSAQHIDGMIDRSQIVFKHRA